MSQQSKKYELDQITLPSMLQTVWGYAHPSQQLHHNDRIRLFGVLMTLQQNRALYERLAEGVTNRWVLDNPALSIKQLFQRLNFDFNNDAVKVELPATTGDVNGLVTIDVNDCTRIQIHRDCE